MSPTPAQQTAAGLAPRTFGRPVNTLDPNFTNQKVYQASACVAQELTKDLSVELSYIFYRGNHLPGPILLGYTPTPGQTVINPLSGRSTPRRRHTRQPSLAAGTSVTPPTERPFDIDLSAPATSNTPITNLEAVLRTRT